MIDNGEMIEERAIALQWWHHPSSGSIELNTVWRPEL